MTSSSFQALNSYVQLVVSENTDSRRHDPHRLYRTALLHSRLQNFRHSRPREINSLGLQSLTMANVSSFIWYGWRSTNIKCERGPAISTDIGQLVFTRIYSGSGHMIFLRTINPIISIYLAEITQVLRLSYNLCSCIGLRTFGRGFNGLTHPSVRPLLGCVRQILM